MNNLLVKRILAWSAVALWMLIIYTFSAQTAAESAEFSARVIRYLSRMFIPDFTTWTAQAQARFVDDWQHVVRKAAHFVLYAGLGGLIMGMLAWLKHLRTNRQRYATAVIGSIIYAMTDEWHQMFVLGRGAMVTDVMIDTIGAAVGAAVVLVTWVGHRTRRAVE